MAATWAVGPVEVTAVAMAGDDGGQEVRLLVLPTGACAVVSVVSGINPDTGGAAVIVRLRRAA